MQTSSKREITQTVVLSVLINGVLPLVGYVLLSPHMSEVAALTIVALIPALDNAFTFAKYRHFDVFGLFMLAGLVLSIGVVLLGGDKKFILIKESFLTGALGLVMLVSLVFPRPILFYFASHFTAGKDEAAQAAFAAQWVRHYFRFVMYLMTIVWGLDLVGEAIVRTFLVLTIDSTEMFLAISPVVQYGFLGAAIAWTVWYARHARRRGAAIQRQREAEAVQLQTVVSK